MRYGMRRTLLAGFTLGAYHSGLFWRSISYLTKSALASCRAISVFEWGQHSENVMGICALTRCAKGQIYADTSRQNVDHPGA